MHTSVKAAFLATALSGFAVVHLGLTSHGRSQCQAPATDQADSDRRRAELLSTGKSIFLARCASCHNERGDKPLRDGPPLNERALSLEKITRAANGRLKDKTPDERRAVALYISSLMKTRTSDDAKTPKPQYRSN